MSIIGSPCPNSLPTIKRVADGSKALESFPVCRVPDAVGDHANGVSTVQQLDDAAELHSARSRNSGSVALQREVARPDPSRGPRPGFEQHQPENRGLIDRSEIQGPG